VQAARTVGRRTLLIAILAGTAGLVAEGRQGAAAGGGSPTGAQGGASGGASGGVQGGVSGGGLTAEGAGQVFVGRRPPLADGAVDWSRLPSEPATAWADASGWAAPLRPVARGPFPRFRLVGFCGLPGAAALGRLGIGSLRDRVADVERMAGRYGVDREPLPVLELIAVVVQGSPGPDGTYRTRVPPQVIRQHLVAARQSGALLLLNVQPGRARFLDEVRALEPWLREPDVGVALDPEWAIGPGQVPGKVFGQVAGSELDAVAGYLSGLVVRGDLPEKAMVVHQLAPPIIRGQAALREHPGVAVVKSVDGIGPAGAKVDTWRRLVSGMPAVMHPGFKLFFDEDARGGSRLMSPDQVLALTPRPEYVMYE
jgi:hypothetical protein